MTPSLKYPPNVELKTSSILFLYLSEDQKHLCIKVGNTVWMYCKKKADLSVSVLIWLKNNSELLSKNPKILTIYYA